MDVNEVLLPGVGLRYELTTADGDRLGVIARRSGDFEVVSYSAPDSDEGTPLFRLTQEEADTVAEILGAPRIAERFADLTREVPGLSAGQIAVPPTSAHAGLPLSHTRARSRTGASIVAIVRGENVIASPAPSEVIEAGDVLVVIGTREGIAGVQIRSPPGGTPRAGRASGPEAGSAPAQRSSPEGVLHRHHRARRAGRSRARAAGDRLRDHPRGRRPVPRALRATRRHAGRVARMARPSRL